MKIAALFGLMVLFSLVGWTVVARLFVWPRLRQLSRTDALVVLITPHLFRFVGLGFLVPGVVSPTLQADFAQPAAYGDLVATVLALLAIGALRWRVPGALLLAWVFNLWGAADLLFAVYQGEIGVRISPGALGGTFYIPTLAVPALLVTHVLIFMALLHPRLGRAHSPAASSRELPGLAM